MYMAHIWAINMTMYSQTSIIRHSMGEQICAGLHRMSDYQIASTLTVMSDYYTILYAGQATYMHL